MRDGTVAVEAEPSARHRTLFGVLAGGALFLTIMLLLAGAAIALGWVRRDDAGGVSLRLWLYLAVIGGTPASVLAGMVSRHVARCSRGPAVLAIIAFGAGVLEAAEILHQATSGGVAAPVWLVSLAPVAAAGGILIGGWLRGRGPSGKAAGLP